MSDIKIDWQKVAGLVPAIVQDNLTNQVLMLGYMDKEALNLSLQTGYAHYFSRTKNRIWKKGESSGNTQKIVCIKLDCDNDTLLLKVEQTGAACHTGETSCFFKELSPSESKQNLKPQNSNELNLNYDILDHLYHIILDRKLNADSKKSYVASLFEKGENAILKKVGEEATELVMAAKDAKNCIDLQKAKSDIVYESADLIFHLMIALSIYNIHPNQIQNELKRRFGLSGIEEKRLRNDS